MKGEKFPDVLYEENIGGETPPGDGELVTEWGVGGVTDPMDVGENIPVLNINAGGDAETNNEFRIINPTLFLPFGGDGEIPYGGLDCLSFWRL